MIGFGEYKCSLCAHQRFHAGGVCNEMHDWWTCEECRIRGEGPTWWDRLKRRLGR